ncbi:response regulator transcription factor [Lentzea alba]|uniref:helix-turn-helix transcriptional regulator n=1 Tax=Lentzea alba TaxID=2714351 RepID=UPI0039BF54BB
MDCPGVVSTTLRGVAGGGFPNEAGDHIAVGLLSGDPESVTSLRLTLRTSPALRFLDKADRCQSDVVLAITDTVDDTFLDALTAVAEEASNPRQRIVLVSGRLQRRHLPRVFSAGVACVLARRDATPQRLARAIFACHRGQAVLPGQLTRWLLDEIRFVQHDLLASQNLAPGGLTTREVEVLRHIAQGDETSEVAAKLSYSERTIKKILQDMLVRLRLQNRAHAVSYAMRVGAI